MKLKALVFIIFSVVIIGYGATKYFPYKFNVFAADLTVIKSNATPSIESDLNEKGLILGSPIFIRIFKESSELEVWIKRDKQFTLFKTYPICAYSGELGPKLKEGDGQSPEGFYFVKPSHMNPNSNFHLSFNLGFPNTYDRMHGRTGSFLMVHGNCVSIGCYAMTDKGIEEIYLIADAALQNRQPFFRVHSFPFRMTKSNMEQHRSNKWYPFWQNLKQGYDFFENKKIPPNVDVEGKHYIFSDDVENR